MIHLSAACDVVFSNSLMAYEFMNMLTGHITGEHFLNVWASLNPGKDLMPIRNIITSCSGWGA
jgi:hypothetical protein